MSSPTSELPSLAWLKKHSSKIHFFGLGFIQIKINSTLRFHFYTGKLESIMPVEEVHNHRYDFTSFILKGELVNEVYRLIPGDTHEVVQVSCKPGEPERPTVGRFGCEKVSEFTLAAGSNYHMKHTVYHRVSSGKCITRVQTEPEQKTHACVFRKVGAEAVCPFSKTVPRDTLWEIIEDMLDV